MLPGEHAPNFGGVPIVHSKDGQVFANSRDVAEYFGKEHFNVLRDIRNLEMPSDLKASFFQPHRDHQGRQGVRQ
ncbi:MULTISPECIES: Rha family transcriptional regulator [Brucella/Ochrobactrum group]|uniref:Rha family transcriptional regulator n=1 Tax=Brucella/Ochrobactrum group TaxID=2826938 RepID=UPI000EFC569B|nr:MULTISPECIES: Rha family transcriptional regulator [Brucella/Ochrobactrum group]KAB2684055.1 hypothetical protein F9K78_05730 [Brucella pseudintermedia]NKE77247.1 hypothetical protein [Ochrobactrum sp. MC-1LL]